MMSCSPQQILILNGSHQAIDLCARMLCDAGDRVWMEDPELLGRPQRAARERLELVPCRSITRVSCRAAEPRPRDRSSFAFPASIRPARGCSRSPPPVRVCRDGDAWVIEDDYDNEIRYHPHSIGAPVRTIARSAGVLTWGTFSKVMFPAAPRLQVVPEDLRTPSPRAMPNFAAKAASSNRRRWPNSSTPGTSAAISNGCAESTRSAGATARGDRVAPGEHVRNTSNWRASHDYV